MHRGEFSYLHYMCSNLMRPKRVAAAKKTNNNKTTRITVQGCALILFALYLFTKPVSIYPTVANFPV